MVPPWFYAPALDPSQPDTVLPADESHHLARVMRLGRGDDVTVFDGRGRQFRGRVKRTEGEAVVVALLGAIDSAPEPSTPITLVQAVLRGDKMDDVVRDATMAGVAHIAPVLTERTVVSMSALTRGHARDRWLRVAIASAKQCRRARLPDIDSPKSIDNWLGAPFDGLRLLLVEPLRGRERRPDLEVGRERRPDLEVGRECRPDLQVGRPGSMRIVREHPRPSQLACLVGPEGGWTAAERDAATKAGCVPVSLGPLTLRADAVGLVAISLLRFLLEDS